MGNGTNENSNNERMNHEGNKNPRRDETNQGNQESVSGKDQNRKWDQAQRRNQASPRGYSENLESQNTKNQNTLSDKEQIDQPGHKEDPNDPKKIGDQISQRQQSIDGDENPTNKKKNRE